MRLQVDQQEAELREWAADEGWEIVSVLKETDRSRHATPSVSATNGNGPRSCWPPATSTCSPPGRQAGPPADIEVSVRLVRTCQSHGVKIRVLPRLYDLTDPDDEHRVLSDMLDASHEAGKTPEHG